MLPSLYSPSFQSFMAPKVALPQGVKLQGVKLQASSFDLQCLETSDLKFHGLDLHDIKDIITRSRSFFAAGRIWHPRRFARRTVMQTDVHRYHTAVTMVYACPVPSALRLTRTFRANSLESGAILCAWVVAAFMLAPCISQTVIDRDRQMTWRVFCGGFAQLLNIVPKMDVMRVRSGNIYSGVD
ncbi:hypothetical protein B0H19DRAFT_1364997 [Mycena capillaripes]|nr:hypothetical protein B0H19DRAFT_1364997 [Mycena capillaripes]